MSNYFNNLLADNLNVSTAFIRSLTATAVTIATNVDTEVDPTSAVTKSMLDSVINGLTVKQSVTATTTADIPGNYDNGEFDDGVGASISIPGVAVPVDAPADIFVTTPEDVSSSITTFINNNGGNATRVLGVTYPKAAFASNKGINGSSFAEGQQYSVDVSVIGFPQSATEVLLLVDGIIIKNGERILIKDQTNPIYNGVYKYTLAIIDDPITPKFYIKLIRVTDFDQSPILDSYNFNGSEIRSGAYFYTEKGTINGQRTFACKINEYDMAGNPFKVGYNDILFFIYYGNNTNFSENVTFVANVLISGGTYISNNLSVYGKSYFTNTLSVTESVYFQNTLSVSGAVVFNNTLSVTGPTVFNNTLSVSGAVVFNNSLSVTGPVVFNNTLSILGSSYIGNILSVSGFTFLNNLLSVTGPTYLNNILSVSGFTYLNNLLSVSGPTYIDNILSVSGASYLNNTLSVSGPTYINNILSVSGPSYLNNILSVVGPAYLNNIISISGAVVFNNTLSVTGPVVFSNTLSVSSSTVLSSTLSVNGTTVLNSILSVNGASYLTGMVFTGSNVMATGDVVAFNTPYPSDVRLKSNINDYHFDQEKIHRIRPVTFNWKKNPEYGNDLGFIAQEVEQIFPELIGEFKMMNDETSYKTIKYQKMIPIMVKTIQDLLVRVKELEDLVKK